MMKNQERQIVTALVFLMFLLWAGFWWHRDPLFPGSFAGGVLGITAAIFMFEPLIYLIIKRIKPLKNWVVKRVSMPTLLLLHIYTGILGPILAVIHSAHRFESIVGILLVLLMFVVVISGFIGRHILSLISTGLREKKSHSDELIKHLGQAKLDFQASVCNKRISAIGRSHSTLLPAISMENFRQSYSDRSAERKVLTLIDAISDVAYSIKIHDTAKLWFKRWIKIHMVFSLTLYALLIFHISAEIYFGLRWL